MTIIKNISITTLIFCGFVLSGLQTTYAEGVILEQHKTIVGQIKASGLSKNGLRKNKLKPRKAKGYPWGNRNAGGEVVCSEGKCMSHEEFKKLKHPKYENVDEMEGVQPTASN